MDASPASARDLREADTGGRRLSRSPPAAALHLDLIALLFEDLSRFMGIASSATICDRPAASVCSRPPRGDHGDQKGRDTKEKTLRKLRDAPPEGYRKLCG